MEVEGDLEGLEDDEGDWLGCGDAVGLEDNDGRDDSEGDEVGLAVEHGPLRQFSTMQ